MIKEKHPLISRIKSIRIEIRWAFIVASISILVIELIFKHWSAPSQTFYRAGDIYLKLCYSISASTIFYFINQHLPKEEKKVKSAIFVNNKVMLIQIEIGYMVSALNINVKPEEYINITQEMVDECCAKTNPQLPVFRKSESLVPFQNWFQYFHYKSLKIKDAIKDLLPLYDILHPDLMAKLLLISECIFIQDFLFKYKMGSGNTDLTPWSFSIYDIIKKTDGATKILKEKYGDITREQQKIIRKERLGQK